VTDRCSDCKHSHLGDQGIFSAHLMCRAHPPQVRISPAGAPGKMNLGGFYPPIDPNGTCGEFTSSAEPN
jgi:hypothetical protein